jgi:hypothetical protein
VPLTPSARPVLLAEVSEPQPGGVVFNRERDRLWNIARRHYFEVVVRPLTNVAQFGAGWYPAETERMDEWRWMAAHSVTTLLPRTGETVLRLNLSFSDDLLPKHPTITVTLNGKLLERFAPDSTEVSRDYHVTPAATANVLGLAIDQTTKENGSGRDLGLRVRFISWGPG